MRDATGRIQRVLVLGGDSDIGTAIAERLVRTRGARHVLLAARRPEQLADRERQLAAAGAEVDVLAFDALAFDDHGELVDEAFAAGDVDVVVLAFGLLGEQTRAEQDAAHARQIVDTNLTGAVSVLVPLAQRLRRQGHGALVVLSSIAAVEPRRANFTYGAAKAGLDAYARGLSDALHGSGARIVVVRPGFVDTKMTDGMEPAPLATDAATVAERTVAALDRPGSGVAYVPPAVRGVAWALQAMPRALLRRLPR